MFIKKYMYPVCLTLVIVFASYGINCVNTATTPTEYAFEIRFTEKTGEAARTNLENYKTFSSIGIPFKTETERDANLKRSIKRLKESSYTIISYITFEIKNIKNESEF